ncbi:MAG: VPLPA-CTERM sorting domain-containing protein [Silicimonas sp.]|nr:VPLPA-CTERM sorting domain-containing protein [Silicimonas sp.]
MTSVAVAALFACAPSVHAACTPEDPDSGDAVTCLATDSDGFKSGKKRLTVTVASGAEVQSDAGKDAIKLQDDDNTIVNIGTIDGDDEAIVGGDGLSVINTGLIRGGDKAIVGENEDDERAANMTILNSVGASIIATGDDAIKGAENLSVTNHGLISAGDKGIQAEDETDTKTRVIVVNSTTGEIRTVDESIEGGDDSVITNLGLITSSEDDALDLGERAVIKNYGTIRNTGGAQDAMDLDSAVITNFAGGLIESLSDGAIDFDESATESRITNHGVIRGLTYGVLVESDPAEGANTAAQIIENAGLIEGGTHALFLGAGEDSYRHQSGATLRGATDFGADNDSFYFEDVLSGVVAGGAVMAGGAGEDVMSFLAYSLADLTDVVKNAGVTSLFFGAGQVNVTGWESFTFADQTVTAGDLTAPMAPVPLPAAGWLVLAGLGALAGMRRFG